MIRVACLVATYQGEDLLEQAVASAAPHVDRVIVLDGAYADVPWKPSSDEDLARAVRAGAIIPARGSVWPGEIEKRNVLLELGRAYVPDDRPLDEWGEGIVGDQVVDEWLTRWALVLDEDEELVHGELLRDWIADQLAENIPPKLVRVEPNGDGYIAPSRLFPLTDTVRYAGRSYQLAGAVPAVYRDLSHYRIGAFDQAAEQRTPFIRHRWDERSPERQELQRAWGRRLAELDHPVRG